MDAAIIDLKNNLTKSNRTLRNRIKRINSRLRFLIYTHAASSGLKVNITCVKRLCMLLLHNYLYMQAIMASICQLGQIEMPQVWLRRS